MLGQLPAVCAVSGVCTALVAALSAVVVPRKAGHTAVKLVLATQFVGLLGYLVKIAAAGACRVSFPPSSASSASRLRPFPPRASERSPPHECLPLTVRHAFLSAVHASMGAQVNGIIFAVYAPGLLLYVLKWPKSSYFGFHEWFHTSVLAGHVVSMACDLRDIVTPCARVALACVR